MEKEKNERATDMELTNMVMIRDKENGKVLVQQRVKSWCGLSFPGGHIEEGESFVDSAAREVREETGLEIRNLQSCGVIHWVHREKHNRYVVFLYRTEDFSGNLLPETDEGRVFWISPEELKGEELSSNFGSYLPMFLSDEFSEAYGLWDDNDPGTITYK